MGHISRHFVIFAQFFVLFTEVKCETFSVKIGTEEHIGIVDTRFLSFTVDPKYLFSNTEKYNSNESICMASALTPAYIRIAGPSTANMVFNNSTITFTDLESLDNTNSKLGNVENDEVLELEVTYSQWKKFVEWIKKTGFSLVFALSNEERMQSGLWDPSSALDILTLADKAGVSDMFWQLGYECRNQSVDDYLSDLETLRVIMETVAADEARGWRAVGGDVSGCLRADSKSDFADYVTLTDEMMDAVLLNGKSSVRELERLSEAERLKLLKRLSSSSTPLWLTESAPSRRLKDPHFELHRAADWMTSLGFSARNGFAVNFRELVEEELFEPTLSFYMALLYKNLVGERVLDVQMDSEGSEAELFAHCTALRHKPVPGAVTLYGVNMGSTPARLSVKLTKREEGGDIMQFILALDANGNIAVNGRAMYHEGDIRPVVKRVRPYKSLLISLPPKSIGFWVLANTNIQACHDVTDDVTAELVEAEDVPEVNVTEVKNVKKRSIEYGINESDAGKQSDKYYVKVSQGLNKRLQDFNSDIDSMHSLFEKKRKNKADIKHRIKRDVNSEENDTTKRKYRRNSIKNKNDSERKPKFELLKKMFGFISRTNNTRHSRSCKVCKNVRNIKNKMSRKRPKQATKPLENINEKLNEQKKNRRYRRSVTEEKQKIQKTNDDILSENKVDFDETDQIKLWKILRNIHEQLKDLPNDDNDDDTGIIEYVDKSDSKEEDEIVVKTKMTDGKTTVNYSEKSKKGLLKNTVSSVVNVLSDLNKNLNRFWNAISLLD